MSVGYRSITWNRFKVFYDLALLVGVCLYISAFLYLAPYFWEGDRLNGPILRMRAYGSCAFLMLTLILCIGPLARLDTRFIPLLYNRRHFGVFTFFVALYHVKSVTDWYHSFGSLSSMESLATAMTLGLDSFSGFPFELLGAGVLLILAIMAFTSHDFWMRFLGPPLWKSLHMLVYLAFGLMVMHVALGALQSERSPFYVLLVGGAVVLVAGLHLLAGWREWRLEHRPARASDPAQDHWVDAGELDSIPEKRARVVTLAGDERVAIFRYDGKLSAVSNVCAHQNGPLGEGKILRGSITCPWHGFMYLPENGCSPPPFNEKIPTYRLKLAGRRILLDRRALPAGTPVEPVVIPETPDPEVAHG